MKKRNTAILIFAQTALKESRKKGFKNSELLFEELNKQIIKKAAKSGLPYFHFSEKEQIGETFGERYTHAIEHIFSKGYENVITIGNDSPQLTTSHLIETAKFLENGNQLALGPSIDGGYYLMGISKARFNKHLFLNLPWQTSKIRSSILKVLSLKEEDVILFDALQDIDVFADIKRFSRFSKNLSKKILYILYAILFSKKEEGIYQISFFLRTTTDSLFNKGSPLLLS
ncbi:MAG: DUF2064 domain-containing protein [Flavobacteriaceae bacterium]